MIEQDDIPETRQDAIRRLIATVCAEENRIDPWRDAPKNGAAANR